MSRTAMAAAVAIGVAVLALLLFAAWRPGGGASADAIVDESIVELGDPVRDITITEASAPGRPIVVIDPGHGGRDPGAPGLSGTATESALTLAFSRELRAKLAASGRVRVALTRDEDKYLTLEQRAAIARQLGAKLFLSVHMDSAPNPLARGATVYSLSDVASDAEAARFAAAENRAGGAPVGGGDASVRYLLADLSARDQMADSADLAARLIRSGKGILFRPEPHKFASFYVLRRSQVPGVLFEAGYISNVDDEAALLTSEGRAPIVAALARAIEVDIALRSAR